MAYLVSYHHCLLSECTKHYAIQNFRFVNITVVTIMLLTTFSFLSLVGDGDLEDPLEDDPEGDLI